MYPTGSVAEFYQAQSRAIDRALSHGIQGTWGCVKCHAVNPAWRTVCNNCGHNWDTPDGRLYTAEQIVEQNAFNGAVAA